MKVLLSLDSAMRRGILALFVVVIMGGAPPAFADESVESAPECSTVAQFKALMEDPATTTITLSGDIVIAEWTEIYPVNAITVEMGDHAILIANGGWLSILGSQPIHFEGNGARQPLFQCDNSGFSSSGGLYVVARADYATAVSLERCTGFFGNFPSLLHIEASGAQATAVLFVRATESPFWQDSDKITISGLDISARGSGGIGIKFDDSAGVRIVGCRIQAGGQAVKGCSSVELNLCDIFPNIAGAVVPDWIVDWTISLDGRPLESNIYRYGFWLVPGEALELPDSLSLMAHQYQGGQKTWSMSMQVPVRWDYDPALLQVPGDYLVCVMPTIEASWISLENFASDQWFEIPLHIAEPSTQYLIAAQRTTWPYEGIALALMHPLGDSEYRLWHRTGEGAWEVIEAKDPRLLLFDNSLRYATCLVVQGIDMDADHQFMLEVLEGPYVGKTSKIDVPAAMEFYKGPGGGDRDGGDQPGDGGVQSEGGGNQPDAEGAIPQEGTGISNEGDMNPQEGTESSGDGAIDEQQGGSEETSDQTDTPHPSPMGSQEGITLSSDELAALHSVRAGLTFIQNGIKVIIPAAALNALQLAEGESFTARLTRPDDQSFDLRFFRGEQPISDFGGEAFEAYIPCSAEGEDVAQVYCTDGSQNFAAIAFENEKAQFELDRAGFFTIHGLAAAASGGAASSTYGQSGNETQTLPVSVGLALGITGAVLVVVTALLMGYRHLKRTHSSDYRR